MSDLSILIIEDDKNMANTLRLLFESKFDCETDTAGNCTETREKLQSNVYDIITLDYRLPDGNGLELLDEMVADENHPPIIMVTGHGDEKVTSEAFQKGAFSYVVKDSRLTAILPASILKALEGAGYKSKRIQEDFNMLVEKYRGIFDHSKSGIAVYKVVGDGDDFVFKDLNKAAEGIDKISKEEVVGKSVLEVFPSTNMFGLLDILQRVWRTGAPEQLPLFKYFDEKTIRWRDNYVYKLSTGEIVAIYEDITEPKRAEEALLNSEAHLEAITEGAMDAIFLLDSKAIIRHWNPAAEKLFGFTEEEAIGQSMGIISPEQSRQAYLTSTESFTLSGQRTFFGEVPSEILYVGKNRTEFPVEISVSRLRIGDEWYAEVIARDITERKRAEDALKEREREVNRAKAMLEETGRMANVGGWEYDVDTGKQVWTPEVYRIHEVDPDFEPTVEKGISFYAPEAVPIISEANQRAIEEGEPFDVELRFITAKGNERWVHAIGRAERVGGRTVKVRGTFQDITDRKQAEEELRESEEHFRMLYDHAGEAIFSYDSELILTDINRVGCEAIGYSREELVGKNILELGILHPDDIENAENVIRRHFDGEDVIEAEYTSIRKDGAERLFTVTGAAIHDTEGNLQSVTNICRDVTEERQVEETLQRVNEELEGYAHTVSHDLKGPLSTASMAFDMLMSVMEKVEMPEEKAEQLREIIDTGRSTMVNAHNIIENLLLLAEAGEPQDVSPVSIEDTINKVLMENAEMIKEKGVAVKVASPLGAVVSSPTNIFQLFTNLIRNSIEHNNDKNPAIEISNLGVDGTIHRFLVRDNGQGIPEEILDDVFTPFVKAQSCGSGIGLSIVEKIVKTYGGEIRAYNDNGACFDFTLRDFDEVGL